MEENFKKVISQMDTLYKINYLDKIKEALFEILDKAKISDEEELRRIIEFSFKTCLVEKLKEFIKEKLEDSFISALSYDYKILVTYLKTGEVTFLTREFECDKAKSFFYSSLVWDKREKLDLDSQKKFLKVAIKKYSQNTFASYQLLSLGEAVEVFEVTKILSLKLDIKKQELEKFKGEFSIYPLGGGDEVGASSYLLNINGNKVLVDAGARIRGENIEYPDFSILKDEDIKCLIITHAHLDHCGALLELLKVKEDLTIMCTSSTKELIEFNLSSLEKGIDKAFSIKSAMERVKVLEFDKTSYINEDLKFTLFRAGHILGASSIFFETSKGNIFFTGDFSIQNQKTVKGLKSRGKHSHILVTETTYGDRDEDNNIVYNEVKMKGKVKSILDKGQSILIPAFALGRAQEIISVIDSLDTRIYVDGGACEVCKIYSKLLKRKEGNRVYYVKDRKDYRREAILEEAKERPLCIVSSSGMLLDGSASANYAEEIISNRDFVIMLTGFQAFDTTGARLKGQMQYNKGERFVDINGLRYEVFCDLEEISLSAHGDVNDITSLALALKARDVVFIHGNIKGRESILFKKIKSLTNSNIYLSKNCEWTKIGGIEDER